MEVISGRDTEVLGEVRIGRKAGAAVADKINAETRRARRSAEKIFCLCATLRSLHLCVWFAFQSKQGATLLKISL